MNKRVGEMLPYGGEPWRVMGFGDTGGDAIVELASEPPPEWDIDKDDQWEPELVQVPIAWRLLETRGCCGAKEIVAQS
jgi:hypothetical protein